jgi:nucleotide-binding universal stress UspA family protein
MPRCRTSDGGTPRLIRVKARSGCSPQTSRGAAQRRLLQEAAMYKRLFVAHDGSEPGAAALHEAIGLAKGEGAELHIVFIVYHPRTFGHPIVNLAAVEEALQAEGRTILDHAAAQAQAAGVTASTALVAAAREPIAATLLGEAANWHADLIVMGTHGRRGLGRAVIGSVAEDLLRAATLPVLLVRVRR